MLLIDLMRERAWSLRDKLFNEQLAVNQQAKVLRLSETERDHTSTQLRAIIDWLDDHARDPEDPESSFAEELGLLRYDPDRVNLNPK